MSLIKSLMYKTKEITLKVCLIVGMITVCKFIYNYGQTNINTVSNVAKCSVMVNPTYGDKIKCTTVSLLKISSSVEKEVSNF